MFFPKRAQLHASKQGSEPSSDYWVISRRTKEALHEQMERQSGLPFTYLRGSSSGAIASALTKCRPSHRPFPNCCQQVCQVSKFQVRFRSSPTCPTLSSMRSSLFFDNLQTSQACLSRKLAAIHISYLPPRS